MAVRLPTVISPMDGASEDGLLVIADAAAMMEGCVASLAERLRALDWDDGGNRAALARYWILFWALRRPSAGRSALTSVAQSTPLSPSASRSMLLLSDRPNCLRC